MGKHVIVYDDVAALCAWRTSAHHVEL